MNIFGWLLLIFVGLPFIELALLIKIGTWIGFWPTIAMIILTGVLGASLARFQGFRVIQHIRAELQAGRMPSEHFIDGVLILVGGIVLLTPGVLTDLWGFAMLIPWTRYWFKRWLRKIFDRMINQHSSSVSFHSGPF